MPNYRRMFHPGGTFALAVVTCGRIRLFDDIAAVRLLGDTVRAVRDEMPFDVICMCLLPDHFHAVWSLPSGDSRYSLRIKEVKSRFTKEWTARGGREANVSDSRRKRGERGVRQRRFWEHTVRDERDLANHIDYIHFNPCSHGLVTKAIDWPHSTFHRYLATGDYHQDWGIVPPEGIDSVMIEEPQLRYS